MLDYKKIGSFICDERKNLKLTQEQLADQLYITRQAVSKWERGICMPDYDSLLKLGELFHVSVNELITGEKSNKGKQNTKYIKIIIIIFENFLLLFYFYELYLISLSPYNT